MAKSNITLDSAKKKKERKTKKNKDAGSAGGEDRGLMEEY